MNWIDNFVRPKIRSILGNKPQIAENLWVKDPESGEMVFYRDLEANQWVVPNSGYHMKIKPADRLHNFFDNGVYQTVAIPSVPVDPLKFRDQKRYTDRLKEQRAKTGADDAVTVATGKLYERDITVDGPPPRAGTDAHVSGGVRAEQPGRGGQPGAGADIVVFVEVCVDDLVPALGRPSRAGVQHSEVS